MTLILFAPVAVRTTVNSVFSSTGAAAAAAARAGSRRRDRSRRRRNAELLFEQLDELRSLEQGQTLNLFCNCVDIRHFLLLLPYDVLFYLPADTPPKTLLLKLVFFPGLVEHDRQIASHAVDRS